MLTPAYPEYFAPIPDTAMALERIGLDPGGDYTPSRENLQKVMLSYTMNVPYENLDIYDYQRRVDFSVPHLFEKFVINRRGGYCFEINGFFMSVLEAIGYECYPLAGRLRFGREFAEPMFHRTTVVTIGGEQFLCDVGYGSGCADGPVSLSEPGVQDILGAKFSIRHHDGELFGDMTLVKHLDTGPEDFYTVYKKPHTVMDFIGPNYNTSTHSDSFFRKQRLVRLRTKTGSISIDGTTFRRKENGGVYEEEIKTNKRLYEILTQEFNMIVPKMTFSRDFPMEWF